MAKKKSPKGKKKSTNPIKKNDGELFKLVEKSIKDENYVFLPHAKQRLSERRISELVVLKILEGLEGTKRKRNKKKDSFQKDEEDWNYCIEGVDSNNKKIRIILSFTEKQMPIITVMWVGKE